MIKKQIKPDGVPDRVKQTLSSKSIPIYYWMLDAGLHQADLLVYAAMFDILRHEPHTPKKINLAVEIGEPIHYTRQAVYGAVDMLVDHGFLYRQGSGRDALFSLYPINKLF